MVEEIFPDKDEFKLEHPDKTETTKFKRPFDMKTAVYYQFNRCLYFGSLQKPEFVGAVEMFEIALRPRGGFDGEYDEDIKKAKERMTKEETEQKRRHRMKNMREGIGTLKISEKLFAEERQQIEFFVRIWYAKDKFEALKGFMERKGLGLKELASLEL